ncbi:MAG: arginyltransferase [Alteromonadaceae bacterium]|jgi:arginyl-tRNA--protein-N-Asp/Glu arginylyltransferase
MNIDFQLGITQSFPCNYLPNQQERLLVATDERLQNGEHYGWLMSQGFRRSGDQIYRPHCELCSACKSLRVLVKEFCLSKSQKRNTKKNNQFTIKISKEKKESYYSLYEQYINTLHKDGSMYPATVEQYKSFIRCNVTKQLYLEIWHDNELISVAVTDVLKDALSAVYTFYHPDYSRHGLGVFSILNQLSLAKAMEKKYIYLGYQIDDCKKMNYKNRYYPYQVLIDNSWQTVNK